MNYSARVKQYRNLLHSAIDGRNLYLSCNKKDAAWYLGDDARYWLNELGGMAGVW